jgi:hypothetical protein
VIVSAEKTDEGAKVRIAVNARFKGASGSHIFSVIELRDGQKEKVTKTETKSGFVYSVDVSWRESNVVSVEATVRSKYGTAKATGSAKL